MHWLLLAKLVSYLIDLESEIYEHKNLRSKFFFFFFLDNMTSKFLTLNPTSNQRVLKSGKLFSHINIQESISRITNLNGCNKAQPENKKKHIMSEQYMPDFLVVC